jgi:four helix bundle protein
MTPDLRVQSTELSSSNKESWQGPGTKSFRNLKVWRRSIELSVAIYRLTSGFPREEVYGLTSQLRRCSVSVASDLAEGYGRASKGEYRQFVGMARGSSLELQTQLVIARALGFGKETLLCAAENLAEEVGKMTWALMQKL